MHLNNSSIIHMECICESFCVNWIYLWIVLFAFSLCVSAVVEAHLTSTPPPWRGPGVQLLFHSACSPVLSARAGGWSSNAALTSQSCIHTPSPSYALLISSLLYLAPIFHLMMLSLFGVRVHLPLSFTPSRFHFLLFSLVEQSFFFSPPYNLIMFF